MADTYTVLIPVRRSYSIDEFLDLDVEREAELITGLYSGVGGRFKYIVVGAPSGGAVQLASILGAPLLPCNILTPVERAEARSPDDIDSYIDESLSLSRRVSGRLGGSADIVIHYDPIHDRGWVSYNLTIRIHLKKLPRAYREFIRRRLRPDGAIVYVDVVHPWLQYRAGDNVYIQIGGADDLEDWEYVRYSDNVKKYIDLLGVERYPWYSRLLDGFDEVRLPESEWGSRRGLLEDTLLFSRELGVGFYTVSVDNFYKLMALGTAAYLEVIGDYRGIVVENYKQGSSTLPLKKKFLPIWAVFTTKRSLRMLDKVLERVAGEGVEEIVYVTVPYGYREQGARWPDSTSITEWINLLKEYSSNVTVIPKEIKASDSTRVLETMNKIYRETWLLTKNLKTPGTPTINPYKLRQTIDNIQLFIDKL